ncbi:G5 domain-containing protein [Agromyces subbeticus]|uniref:G5 domain-containing protein n=1 Tax=Agromyces subbeticus TaxID=293890 RepID=UPI001FE0F3DD|nr:G5 domain-containing protein [Agromyces subbeticus]
MPAADPGWFDDGSGELRWWDGTKWATFYVDANTGAVINRGASPAGQVATVATQSGVNFKAAIITFSTIVVVILVFWGPAALLLASGVVAGAVGLYAVLKGSFGRLRIRTRPVAVAVLVAGIFASTIGGAALTATQQPLDNVASFAGMSSSSPRATVPTPTPTPTPVRKESVIEESATIAYTSSTVDDANLDAGLTAVATPGANGQKVTRIRVVTVDGVEISREVIEEVVTVHPVNEVIAVGSRQPPPPPPPGPADNGCDSNYEGACVPVSSDVDCLGGSGDGPGYVDGPVRIVGADIYDLDRDGDGIACDA